jgi:hypothetical protein
MKLVELLLQTHSLTHSLAHAPTVLTTTKGQYTVVNSTTKPLNNTSRKFHVTTLRTPPGTEEPGFRQECSHRRLPTASRCPPSCFLFYRRAVVFSSFLHYSSSSFNIFCTSLSTSLLHSLTHSLTHSLPVNNAVTLYRISLPHHSAR